MSYFLSREAELLGGDFVPSGISGLDGDIDVERAISAFPDLGLDDDLPPSITSPSRNAQGSTLSFDDFEGTPGGTSFPDLNVIEDNDIDKFENQFPSIDGSRVRQFSFCNLPYHLLQK